ncbi:MAG: hypothetical protein FWD03_09435 [Defluviitaleaceae bacterium]|nr:hypothetical protein [Defluviitaleaceae bacterium]
MTAKPRIDPAFKQLIPPLSDEEYRQLEANIVSSRKCRDAIILWDGIIIDGHNRFYICATHGIEFEVKEMTFESREEVKLWILENQMGRRNLTDAMRIELALCKADMLKEKARANQSQAGGDRTSDGALLAKRTKPINEPINVRKTMAKDAAVGEKTLYMYTRIKAEGCPALLEKVQSGEIKIGTAYRMLPRELEKQLKQADKWYAYIHSRFPFEDNEEWNRDIQEALDRLAAQRDALIEKMDALEPEEALHATKN